MYSCVLLFVKRGEDLLTSEPARMTEWLCHSGGRAFDVFGRRRFSEGDRRTYPNGIPLERTSKEWNALAYHQSKNADQQLLRYRTNLKPRLAHQAKDMTYSKFKSWGVEYIPSFSNFICYKTDCFGSTDILTALQEKNIMIRNYADVPRWARVSMGI